MIDDILAKGNPVSAAHTIWLREKMAKISRYRNLEPTLSHFTVGWYKGNRMLYGWKNGRGIPIPKRELSHSLSKKTRVLGHLRKVIEYQVKPHRKHGWHVDHVYPFEAIVNDWLSLHGLTWDKVTARHYPSFDQYHLAMAQYQLLSPAENIKKSNKLSDSPK
jgi:hypothetical protein